MVRDFYRLAPELAPTNDYMIEVRAGYTGASEVYVYTAPAPGTGRIGVIVKEGDWIIGTEYGIETLSPEVFGVRFEVTHERERAGDGSDCLNTKVAHWAHSEVVRAAFLCDSCRTVDGCSKHYVFKCGSCARPTWWRDGGADEHPGDCADCWNAKHEHGAAATFATGKDSPA